MRTTPITTREQVAPEFYYAYDEVVATYNNHVVGPLRVLFYCPELARRISNIGAFMRVASPFPAPRELAIIAAAREWDCLYEWGAHEPGAKRTGVSEASIDAVRHKKPLAGLPPEEALIIQYVRNLLRRHRVPQAVFNKVQAKLGVQGIVELTTTIGFYQVFACVMNAFEVPSNDPIDFPVHLKRGRPFEESTKLPPYHGTKARIPLIASKEELPTEGQAAFGAVAINGGRRDAGTFQVLLHSPEVAQRTAQADDFIRSQLSLPPHVQELAILTTAQVNECSYLRDGHEAMARRAGVPEHAIAAATDKGPLDDLPPTGAQVIGFTQTLLRKNRVPEAEFQGLMDRFGLQGTVQLSTLIGYFSMMSCVLNAFEVPSNSSANLPTAQRPS